MILSQNYHIIKTNVTKSISVFKNLNLTSRNPKNETHKSTPSSIQLKYRQYNAVGLQLNPGTHQRQPPQITCNNINNAFSKSYFCHRVEIYTENISIG